MSEELNKMVLLPMAGVALHDNVSSDLSMGIVSRS
jgi:hypothetical protein